MSGSSSGSSAESSEHYEERLAACVDREDELRRELEEKERRIADLRDASAEDAEALEVDVEGLQFEVDTMRGMLEDAAKVEAERDRLREELEEATADLEVEKQKQMDEHEVRAAGGWPSLSPSKREGGGQAKVGDGRPENGEQQALAATEHVIEDGDRGSVGLQDEVVETAREEAA